MHLFQSYSIDKNCTQLDKRGERTGGSGLRNMIPTRQLLPNNYSLVWIEWMNEIEDTVQCKEHRNVRTETETILNHSLSWFYRRSKRSRAGKWLAPNHCGGRPGVSIQVILVIVLVFWMKKSHTHTHSTNLSEPQFYIKCSLISSPANRPLPRSWRSILRMVQFRSLGSHVWFLQKNKIWYIIQFYLHIVWSDTILQWNEPYCEGV